MDNYLESLPYAQLVYLSVMYSTITDDIKTDKSEGQIIRSLCKDGLKMDEALELFELIRDDIEATLLLIQKLKEQIAKIEKAKELEDERIKAINKNVREYGQKHAEQQMQINKSMEDAKHVLIHSAPHLALHLVRMFLGV